MCLYIIVRHGPNPFNPLKRCLGVRTSHDKYRTVEWQMRSTSFTELRQIWEFWWNGNGVIDGGEEQHDALSDEDASETQPLLRCECCGEKVGFIDSGRWCGC